MGPAPLPWPRGAQDLLLSRLPAAADAGEATPPAASASIGEAIRRLAWAAGDFAARTAVLDRIGQPAEAIPDWAQFSDRWAQDGGAIPAELDATAAGITAGDGPPDRLAALEQVVRAGQWSALVDKLIGASPSGNDDAADSLSLAI